MTVRAAVATIVLGLTLASSPAWAQRGRARFISEWLAHYPKTAAELPAPAEKEFLARVSKAALDLHSHSMSTYDPAYVRIAYPGGDVPVDRGVCTDVVIRTFRKLGIDLQAAVHEDMVMDFSAYPDLWSRGKPDSNIDHRRVPNLMVYFARHGKVLPLSKNPDDYRPGDIVTWDLGGGLTHIGLVVDARNARGNRPMIVHHISFKGPTLEDFLFDYPVIGHFRLIPAAR